MLLLRVNLLVVCFTLVASLKDYGNYRIFKKTSKFSTINLPSNLDLIKYLESLHGVINFYSYHKNDIDINLYFGFFLANVNLKRALQEKYESLPGELRVHLKVLIGKSEKQLNYFSHMVKQDYDQQNNKYKIIFLLFENTSMWINRLQKYNISSVSEAISQTDLGNAFSNWTSYTKNVDDVNEWVPNPQESDKCLLSLALVKEVHNGSSRICRVPKPCHEMLLNGTNFGYALAHRLLFLQQAKYGRGCSIFSEEGDKRMSQRFCSIAYQEAEYIAMHDFQIVDLFLEHVCLCALEGYGQFLQRFWLANILRFQTSSGCFSQHDREGLNISKWPKSRGWKIIRPRNYVLDGYCNSHTTALAASTLVMASRFIIESYY